MSLGLGILIDLLLLVYVFKISKDYQIDINGKKFISFLVLMFFASFDFMLFLFEALHKEVNIISWILFLVLIAFISYYYAKYPEKVLVFFGKNLRKLIFKALFLKYSGILIILLIPVLAKLFNISFLPLLMFHIGVYLYVLYRLILLAVEAKLFHKMGFNKFIASFLWLIGSLGLLITLFILRKKSRLRDF